MSGLFGGLGENHAVTDPTATDPRLRGRTYAIPFEAVWQASVGLTGGGQRGWSLESTDDQRGVIEASVRGGGLSVEVDIRIAVSLDENAQTRVDLSSASRTERGDWGYSRRTIGRFIHKLDLLLEAAPGQILDGTRTVAWPEAH